MDAIKETTLRLQYEDSCDLINALELLQKELPKFGVKLEILNGGEGYEEIKLSEME